MLIINNLTKKFAARTLLDNISFNFPSTGILALVGANGAGKSTLLNILCNLEEADSGSITKPKDYAVAYLPQDPNQHPKPTILEECISGAEEVYELKQKLDAVTVEMETAYTDEVYEEYERVESLYRQKNGYALEAKASQILAGLGFKQEQLESHPTHISGGWRMRLELAKILLKDPNFLILDEPTNHLDLPSILWLEEYLKKFKGVVLFVSHDEDLLVGLPNKILHLKAATLREYTGNYYDFLEQYEQIEEQKKQNLENVEKKIKQLSVFVDKFKAKASKATQAQSKMKMIAKMRDEASGIVVDRDDQEINIRIPLTTKSGKDVLELKDLCIGNNNITLVKNINLHVARGQKIAVIGANGIGKSTFMKTLVGETPAISGEMKLGFNSKMAYFAQDQLQYLDMTASVLENVQKFNADFPLPKARSLLGSFLFKSDDVFKKASVLSGGEKNRLSLACMLVKDANFLLLDEPTNHLDISSIEVLAHALKTYEGTAMFISHNRNFINTVATHIMVLQKNGKTYLYEGTLEDVPADKLL